MKAGGLAGPARLEAFGIGHECFAGRNRTEGQTRSSWLAT
jgi:hypothetical protein